MIKEIFLGKPWHWALGALVVVLFWLCGRARLHVIEFNLFAFAILAGSAATVLVILALHKPGEQITRDEIKPATGSETETRPDASGA